MTSLLAPIDPSASVRDRILDVAQMLFADQGGRPQFKEFCKFMQSDVVVGLEIVGENSIERMNIIAGPESPTMAKEGTERD